MAHTVDQALASAETVFEVQQLRNGRWHCLSTHSDRVDATTAADAFAWRNRQAEVRVVHSQYDDGKGLYVERVVFRHKPTDPKDLKVQEQETAYSRIAEKNQKRRAAAQRARKIKRARQREQWNSVAFYARIIFWGVALLGGGVLALHLLRGIA